MDGTNGLRGTTGITAAVASNTLGVNVFTAPEKAMVGERPRPFGEALGFDPITSTLIFGGHDAVLVNAMMTVAEAEALADWVALHNRNLETIQITHAHFDHFYGLDHGAGPVSSAESCDCCRRSQEAWRARLSFGDRGNQALRVGLRSGAENRDVGPGPVRSDTKKPSAHVF
jgi:glyoxylase-like metal-dependent hydrolase (beta-lactamase superfamily II)